MLTLMQCDVLRLRSKIGARTGCRGGGGLGSVASPVLSVSLGFSFLPALCLVFKAVVGLLAPFITSSLAWKFCHTPCFSLLNKCLLSLLMTAS